MIKKWLTHPLTRGLNIDDPDTTRLRQRIIEEKVFLRQIYIEWYEAVVASLPLKPGPILELGSGAGFLRDFIPDLISSDIIHCPEINLLLDGQRLPFAEKMLRAIVMVNTLHHIPNPRLFFSEAIRCLQRGGVVIMIEPWFTPWSSLIYTKFHHEPFNPEAVNWEFPTSGPLSGANGALRWIIFYRDRTQFEREFSEFVIKTRKPLMPFRYLLSGGLSMRCLVPGWTFGFWRQFEKVLRPWVGELAMFAQIVLQCTR
jgi:SAM-dependent methyltransferase